jgi:hypothetical protein
MMNNNHSRHPDILNIGALLGVIADVSVKQTYANDGIRPISARYIFPASTRAAVHGMKMTIGNQVITAKIKEREAAQKQFDQAKSEGGNGRARDGKKNFRS